MASSNFSEALSKLLLLVAVFTAITLADPNAIVAELGPSLSGGSGCIFPRGTKGATDIMKLKLYPALIHPDYFAVVVPETENDVVEAVKWANKYSLPIHAQSGGHGSWEGLSDIHNGILIWLRKLAKIEIRGEYATIQGGVVVDQLYKALTNKNKRTAHAVCGCISHSGPALGGGHGQQEAKFGLVADQMVSVNIVLYNGTSITASDTSNTDLFWGLRGAGWNFGIVTSVQYKLHDIPQTEWQYRNFFYKFDQLPKVLNAANKLADSGNNADENLMGHWAYLAPNATDSSVTVTYQVVYEGTREKAAPYFAPFEAIRPVRVIQNSSSTYTAIAEWMQETGEYCPLSNVGIQIATVSLPRYNIDNFINAANIFKEYAFRSDISAANPVAVFETHGKRANPHGTDATAVSPQERNARNVIAFELKYPAGDDRLKGIASSYTVRIKQALLNGVDPRQAGTYANYADGTHDTIEEMYGYNDWRLSKLRRLKAQYDPNDKFGNFAPFQAPAGTAY